MTRIAIIGYGNIGRGVEINVKENPDMELAAIFTRRDPATVKTLGTCPVLPVSEIKSWAEKIDVAVVAGGSATDLPHQTPEYAKLFNVIDTFDTHANISSHFANVDGAAKESGHVGIIACGWDPGMFSLARLYANAILPKGHDYTFWGRGVSQGHSDAIRRIEGVQDARQYTVPIPEAMEAVRAGKNPELSTREKHLRECYVVLKDGADAKKVEEEIKNMPNYFADNDTTVNFISQEELDRNHRNLPHGGFVFRTGSTGEKHEHNHIIEYSLKLDSNPEFTTSVLMAFIRAAHRLSKEGRKGAFTVFDIPPKYLLSLDDEEIRNHLL